MLRDNSGKKNTHILNVGGMVDGHDFCHITCQSTHTHKKYKKTNKHVSQYIP